MGRTEVSNVPAAREAAGELREVKIHTADGKYLGKRSREFAERVVAAGSGYWRNGYVQLNGRSTDYVTRLYQFGRDKHVHRSESFENVRNVWAFRKKGSSSEAND